MILLRTLYRRFLANQIQGLPEISFVESDRQGPVERGLVEAARIDPVAYDYALRKRREWNEDDIDPTPLISGDDLIALGFVPGPEFREILTRVEDEQLEGRLLDREQAIEFVRRCYGERDGC